MSITISKSMSLGMLVLMVTALSCSKNEKPAAQEEAVVEQKASDETTTLAAAARIPSPVPGKVVTYPFGIVDPRYAAGYHTGDDYAAPTGTPVVAVLGGTIAWSNNTGGAYGRWIGLRATNGRDYVYCHLSVRSVSTGATVVAGQKLGEVGATGNVTGPHLHFEDRPRGGGYGQVRKPTW
ncbi:M23 family metallopeptidase [Pseudoflavitalea sp. X16]|uniref:M23 family metallopeptidase n=1 Tax=Paraflavitalea devenefica TaxID=2716334 RepID=UPI001422B452|nr:M23 family metallopeptidase [Paraflavitalea devenefica]NII28437.1 M23 family metallopeptidase [Paraflavitalea devenefica]